MTLNIIIDIHEPYKVKTNAINIKLLQRNMLKQVYAFQLNF